MIKKMSMSILLTIALLAFAPMSSATDLSSQSEALSLILQFSEKFCKDPSMSGSTESNSLTIEGKAELNGLIKKIANLGIGAAGKYENDNYQGLLQKDLIKALENSQNCKMVVWNDLNDKLILPLKEDSVEVETKPTLPGPGIITQSPSFQTKVTRESISVRVINVVSEQLGIPRNRIHRESSYIYDLGADEFDMLEIVMAFEEEFEIPIPDRDVDIAGKTTIENSISYISMRLGVK